MSPPDPILEEETRPPLTCHELDQELLWIPRARVDLTVGGIVATVGPAGHPKQVGEVVLPWKQLEASEATDVSQVVGRRLYRRRQGYELLPPQITGPRPLLLARQRPPGAFGDRALDSLTGARLATAVGLPLGALLQTFETRHLLEEGEETSVALRRLDNEGALDGRTVVVIGEQTATLLASGSTVTERIEQLGGRYAGVVPHPSSGLWKNAAAFHQVRQRLVEVVLAVRGVGSYDVDALARAERLARCGRFVGWQALAELGIVSHSPTTGHAWRPLLNAELPTWAREWRRGRMTVELRDGRWQLHVVATRGSYFQIAQDTLSSAVAMGEAFAACHGRDFIERANREEVAW